MTTELAYLTLVAALTGLLWIPYILNMIKVRGLLDAVGYPEHPKPLAGWATRMRAAHLSAVENLVVFAALVLAAQDAGCTMVRPSSRARPTSGHGWCMWWFTRAACRGRARWRSWSGSYAK